MKRLFFNLLLVSVGSLSWAQSTSIQLGHIAFGESRYDDAINHYQNAIDSGSTWDWLPEMKQTAQDRKDLGSIIPADTHKIGIIFIRQLNITTDTGLTVQTDVTPEQMEEWRINFDLLREIYEAWSDGNWTVSFDSVNAVATYEDGANLKPDNPDHLNLEDYWLDYTRNHDSYITFSKTRSPAMALSRRYPYINGEYYSPSRGMAAINSETHGFTILIHEFFHIIEWVSNAIPVTHGYTAGNRSNYPGWTDTTEYSYYKYHFESTLPSVPWDRLQHRTRWIPTNPQEWAQDSLQSIYSLIPLNDRHTADTLSDNGMALKSTNIDSAAIWWNMALTYSPYHYQSLYELVDYYRFDSINPVKADEIAAKLRLTRNFTDFHTIDTINNTYGEVIGHWHREDLLTSYDTVEWNVTSRISQNACNEFRFYYTEGWKAAEINEVQLLEDGVMISNDAHYGFSGNAKTDIDYYLDVASYNGAANYTLRAIMRGGSGTDSYGQIHHIENPGSCVSGSPKPLSTKITSVSPNPANNVIVVKGDINGQHRISIISVSGNNIRNTTTSKEVNISHLNPGCYILKIELKDKIEYHRFIKN